MKKFICLILCILCVALPLCSCESIPYAKSKEVTNFVVIDVEDYGKIVIELYPDIAPITVKNFQDLVAEGFYDGLTFHRVIQGFVIQGGSTDGYGYEGSDKNIKGEFEANGIPNSLSHKRGVISMARAGYSNDTASSQFFICHGDASDDLDGQYAAFGEVVYGMEVVDAIASTRIWINPKSGAYDMPLEKIFIKKAYFVTPEN